MTKQETLPEGLGVAKFDFTKILGALLNFIYGLLFEKTYLIVIKDETGLKTKLNASTLILIGSYVRKLVASYLKKGR